MFFPLELLPEVLKELQHLLSTRIFGSVRVEVEAPDLTDSLLSPPSVERREVGGWTGFSGIGGAPSSGVGIS